ncbi:MAG: hypothetical protein II954_10945 [Synergistaceae bacterium]|nr:hypothetical protein [Synergistaceae bacterium]
MRKIKFWSLLLMLALLVSAFSGCGGSADTDKESSGDVPNTDPDTYDTMTVLGGNWAVVDQEVSVSAAYSDDLTLDMSLVSATMNFTDTQITGSRGITTLTLHESWQCILDGDTRVYMGIVPINLDDVVTSMIQSGADNWRCELYDAYRTVMNIEVKEEKLIQVSEHRIAMVDDVHGIEYEAVLTFRKQ